MTAPSLVVAASAAKSGEAVKSGPIGLAIILLLCVACYFLFKSMSKHLKTVREDFPLAQHAPTDTPTSPAGPAPVAPVAPVAPGVEPAPPGPGETR